MWIRQCYNGCPWYRVDPLNNPNANYTNLPPGYNDIYPVELNDVIFEPLPTLASLSSGVIFSAGSGLNSFPFSALKIHKKDRPDSNGPVHTYNSSSIKVFGSILPTIHARDVLVTSGVNSTGEGLGIYEMASYLNNEPFYQVKFDEFENDNTNDWQVFFNHKYNTNLGLDILYGNHDFQKLYRLPSEPRLWPHKLINTLPANGILYTRAHKSHIGPFVQHPTLFADTPKNLKYNEDRIDWDLSVWDAAGNRDDASNKITIDNFLPFVSNIRVDYSNAGQLTNLAILNRYQNEGSSTSVNDGFIYNRLYFSNRPKLNNSTGMRITASTSEVMKTMQCRLVQSSTTYQNMTRSIQDPKIWTFDIPTAPDPTSNQYEVTFQGTDQADNPLINVRQATSNNSSATNLPISYRTSASAWSSNPVQGSDGLMIEIDPTCPSNLRSNDANRSSSSPCFVDNLTSQSEEESFAIAYSACGGTVNLVNGDLTGLNITWDGYPQFQNMTSVTFLTGGTYCYTFTEPNTCCKLQGCVTIDGSQISGGQSMNITDNYTVVTPQRCDPRFGGGVLDLSNPSFISGGVGPFTLYEIRNGSRYLTLTTPNYVQAQDSILIEALDSRGCSTFKSLLMPYGGFPEIIGMSNPPACTSVNDSPLLVSFMTETGLDYATMWNVSVTNNGQTVTSYADAEILTIFAGPGLHLITLSDKAYPNCRTTYEVLKEDARNNNPMQLTLSKQDLCASIKGNVTASVTGGTAPIRFTAVRITDTQVYPTMYFSDVLTGLDMGIYDIIVSDACDNTVVQRIEIKGILQVEIRPYMLGCTSKGEATHVEANVIGDFPPFSYSWSGGASTAMTTLPNYIRQTVTVTDTRGCTATKESLNIYRIGNSDRVTVATTPTCPFSNNGTATISVNNYNNEIVRIYFDSFNLITPSTASIVTHTMTGLSSVSPLSVVIKIGDCDGYCQEINIPHTQFTYNHKRVFRDAEGTVMCEHDILCDGNVVFQNQLHPVNPYLQAQKFGCEQLVFKCGNDSIVQNLSSRWMFGYEAKRVLESNGLPPDFYPDFKGCYRYKVCENGRGISKGNFGLCSDEGVSVGTSGNCILYDCNCLLRNDLVLDCPLNPSELFIANQDAIRKNCVIKGFRGFQYDLDLHEEFNLLAYNSGSLKPWIEANKNRQDFKCATVYYCQYEDKMVFMKSDIDLVTCGSCGRVGYFNDAFNCSYLQGEELIPKAICNCSFYGRSAFIEWCSNQVSVVADYAPGSLRNAIDCASENDSITLDASLGIYSIDSLLMINKHFTIKGGDGSPKPELKLQGQSAWLEIPEFKFLTIQNMRITSNNTLKGLVNNGALILRNVDFIGKEGQEFKIENLGSIDVKSGIIQVKKE